MTKREMYLEMYNKTNFRKSDYQINKEINNTKKERFEEVYNYYLKEKATGAKSLKGDTEEERVHNLAVFCINVL